MKVGVKILPRSEVLDVQGRAVEQVLRSKTSGVESCHIGRYVVLSYENKTTDEAMALAKEAANLILHNPLIEQFELEKL